MRLQLQTKEEDGFTDKLIDLEREKCIKKLKQTKSIWSD
jgi:hypothetical protein